jgi:CMP-N,N'-diacetyllegionaminic acid synthase
MNASIYIWKRDTILEQSSLFLGKTGLYVMPEERSIDIDTELDFEFVEFLMRKNHD